MKILEAGETSSPMRSWCISLKVDSPVALLLFLSKNAGTKMSFLCRYPNQPNHFLSVTILLGRKVLFPAILHWYMFGCIPTTRLQGLITSSLKKSPKPLQIVLLVLLNTSSTNLYLSIRIGKLRRRKDLNLYRTNRQSCSRWTDDFLEWNYNFVLGTSFTDTAVQWKILDASIYS